MNRYLLVPTSLLASSVLFLPSGLALDLETTVRERLDALPAQTTAFAKHLGTGRQIAVRADEPMNTVSVIKLPIMVLAYREAEAGRFSLDERHVIRVDERRRGSGLLQDFVVGLNPTYRDLVAQMIVTSDNTATDILIARLGLERVNQLLESLGYKETRLRMTIGQLFRGCWEDVDPKLRSLTDAEAVRRPGRLRGSSSSSRVASWRGRRRRRRC
jgi:beta-lactamase class A